MGCLIPVLALAAAAAGTGMQVAGANKAANAMNNKTVEELNRQRGTQQKASAEFASSLGQSGKDVADTQIASGEQERTQMYDKLQSVPLAAGSQPLVGGTSSAINLRDNAQMALSNKGRGKIGAYDKWILDQAVKNLRSGQMQGIYGQEAQRSQAVLPMELQDASHAGDSLTGAGMGLGMLGTLLSLGSTSGVTAGMTAAQAGTSLYGMNQAQPVMGYGYR